MQVDAKWASTLLAGLLHHVADGVVSIGTLMKSISAMGYDTMTMWRFSHVLYNVSCTAWYRSHACITEAANHGFTRSLRNIYEGT